MSDLLSFEEIARLFTSLGVRDFGAALPEGRIQWMNAEGTVVANGRCVAVLSWAAPNQSIAWAEALPHFKDAGVPTVARPEGLPEYQVGVPEGLAEQLANRAAKDAAALFLYTAPTGGGSKLFLAVTAFEPVAGSVTEAEA